MKLITLIGGIIISLLLSSCSDISNSNFTSDTGVNESNYKNSLTFSDSLSLQFQDTLFTSEENLWLTFDSLIADSRCPVNVECVWAGNATLRFTFSKDGDETRFNLNTHPDFLNDTTISGYGISLLDVKPYPHTDSLRTQQDYSAIISISNK